MRRAQLRKGYSPPTTTVSEYQDLLDGLLKEIPQAQVAQRMSLYLKKKTDLWGDPRWETVRQYEAAGQRLEAMMLRDRIKMEVRKADQTRRYQAGL